MLEEIAGLTLDADVLAPLVSAASGRPGARPIDWQTSMLHGGGGNPTSAGVYRLAGRASADGLTFGWSMILKAVQSPASVGWLDFGEQPEHWNYWKREVHAYQSGLLTNLPGIEAPGCYGTIEQEQEQEQKAWLWLEDVGVLERASWGPATCGRAAYHLGRFHAAYLAHRSIPNEPWLSGSLLSGWSHLTDSMLPVLEVLGSPVGPFAEFHQLRPTNQICALAAALTDFGPWLEALDSLPQTLCHQDANMDNLQLRGTAEDSRLVAIDWQLMGRGPLAGDVALLTASLGDAHGPASWRQEDSILSRYRAGLEEGEIWADAAEVRLGYVLTTVLRQGWYMFYSLARQMASAQHSAQSQSEFVRANRFTLGRLVDLTQEARRLLGQP